MIVSARGKRITIAAEFDAMVLGDSKTFNRFSAEFVHAYRGAFS